jgi:hypothetical protein
MPGSMQQVNQKGVMPSGIVAKGLDFLPIHGSKTHSDT